MTRWIILRAFTERWMSGLSRTPGKRVYVESRTVGSNPTLSANKTMRLFMGRFCKFNLQFVNVLAVQPFGKDTLPPSFLTIKKGVLFAALSLDRPYRFRCHEKRR